MCYSDPVPGVRSACGHCGHSVHSQVLQTAHAQVPPAGRIRHTGRGQGGG